MEGQSQQPEEPETGTTALRHLFPSSAVLILSNLVPLWGVVFQGWDVFAILFLFWSENMVIGVFNVLRMVVVRPKTAGDSIMRIFMIPFFTFHYGMFTLAHGVFVLAFFSGIDFNNVPEASAQSAPWTLLFTLISHRLPRVEFLVAFAALFASHAVSFFSNFIGRGEFRITDVNELMMRPYGRVIVLHVTILAGGFAVLGLHAPQLAIVVLVLIKMGIDLKAHLSERKKFCGIAPTIPSGSPSAL